MSGRRISPDGKIESGPSGISLPELIAEENYPMVFRKVANDALVNVLLYGVGIFVVLFIARYVRLLAIGCWAVFYVGIGVVMNSVPVLISVGCSFTMLYLRLFRGEATSHHGLRWIGTTIRVLELAVTAYYTLYLYRHLF